MLQVVFQMFQRWIAPPFRWFEAWLERIEAAGNAWMKKIGYTGHGGLYGDAYEAMDKADEERRQRKQR